MDLTQVNACETAAKGGAKKNVSQADGTTSAGSQVRVVRQAVRYLPEGSYVYLISKVLTYLIHVM